MRQLGPGKSLDQYMTADGVVIDYENGTRRHSTQSVTGA